jgi:hypothetical protein
VGEASKFYACLSHLKTVIWISQHYLDVGTPLPQTLLECSFSGNSLRMNRSNMDVLPQKPSPTTTTFLRFETVSSIISVQVASSIQRQTGSLRFVLQRKARICEVRFNCL